MHTASLPLDPTLDSCPVVETLRVVGGRWKPVILFHLRPRPRRFNELRRLIPTVTQRMLTQHLRELEADGVVLRRVFQVVPPHVEYAVAPAAAGLYPVLDAMAAWGAARGAGGEAGAPARAA